jgi:hypothetical protein
MGKGEKQTGRFVFAGHNLWPALLGKNLTSPRTEVPKILRIIDLSFDLPLHLDLFGSIYDVVIAPEQVIHAVHNSYFNHSLGNWPITAARFGDWKIIVGKDCGTDQVWQAWPTPGVKPVPFGLTGGWLEQGAKAARLF